MNDKLSFKNILISFILCFISTIILKWIGHYDYICFITGALVFGIYENVMLNKRKEEKN